LAPKWRRQLLAIAVLLLAWLVGNKLTDRQEGTLRGLLREAAALERRSAAAAALQVEVDRLLDQVETLRAKRPVDPYRLLTELQAVLGPEARLQSFLLERRFFQFEAVGANPLRLMDAFGGSVYFGETRLLQTVPLSGSQREAFKITGSVRGE
jgi:hypothetical protein